MRTKVVSFFIFVQDLLNKTILRSYDQKWLKEPQGGPPLSYIRKTVLIIRICGKKQFQFCPFIYFRIRKEEERVNIFSLYHYHPSVKVVVSNQAPFLY